MVHFWRANPGHFSRASKLKRPLLEYCFDRELKKQATFNGFLVLKLSVAASGRVTEVGVEEGNPRDRAVGSCIVNQLRTLKLPPLASDADLLLPIRLQATAPVWPELHAEAEVTAAGT